MPGYSDRKGLFVKEIRESVRKGLNNRVKDFFERKGFILERKRFTK
jgi:hypothetical protein